MTSEAFTRRLKERLYPEIYPTEIASAGEFEFVLRRSGASRSTGFLGYSSEVSQDKPNDIDVIMPGGRYVFACRQVMGPLDRAGLRNMRGDARRLARSIWFLRGAGLYLLVCGAKTHWRDATQWARADRTGLHNIILQAIHFVDPETGATHLSQSAWGPFKFGRTNRVAEAVAAVLATPDAKLCGLE